MFTLLLQTKPYVHHFLISNFGDPADLSPDRRLQTLLRRCLKKPSRRRNTVYRQLRLSKYPIQSKIVISQDDFYRYGWEMTKTDTIYFGRELENRAKFMMRSIVSLYMTFKSQKDSILMFQESFGYTEDIWSYDSIKKDFSRNSPEQRVDFIAEITEKSERIILGNLSDLGTICPKYLKEHAKRKQTA